MEEKSVKLKPTIKPVSMKHGRKIIQIAYGVSNAFEHTVGEMETESGLFALCDDGSLWKLVYFDLPRRKGNEWVKLVGIPQD